MFQRFMDQALKGLNFCYDYIDNLLIVSTSPQEHDQHLRLVFERLRDYGIILNQQPIWYNSLATLLIAGGIHPLNEKVQAIQDFPQPTTVRQLWKFLFIPHGAKFLQPLNTSLSQRFTTISWSAAAAEAFQQVKEVLASATLLAHPKPDALTNIVTDASDTAVRAVLQQFIVGNWRPISKLQSAETHYSMLDTELLVIYLVIKHFRHFMDGHTFHVITNHKPLTYALAACSDRHSPRQARHLGFHIPIYYWHLLRQGHWQLSCGCIVQDWNQCTTGHCTTSCGLHNLKLNVLTKNIPRFWLLLIPHLSN